MDHRVLEICYDVAAIPGRNPHNPADPRVFRFRDAAMARIAAMLDDDGLGHGLDARLEDDRLHLKFLVMDFDAAEARLGPLLDRSSLAKPVEVLRYWDDVALI